MRQRSAQDDAATLMSAPQLLLYPLRGQGGVLLFACSIALYVLAAAFDWAAAEPAYRLMLPLFITLPIINVFGVFQLHAWLALRRLALGHIDPASSIAIADVSPYRNYLAFKVALLLAFVAAALLTATALSSTLGVVLYTAAGMTLPAMLGVMALEQRFRDGLNPSQLARLIRGLGNAYLAFAAALAVGIGALLATCLVMSPPRLLTVISAGYLFVLGHVLAGRLLYLRRSTLKLATVAPLSPQEVETLHIADTIDTLMLDLHGLCRSGGIKTAAQKLDAFLRESNYSLDEHIHQRLQVFQEQRLLVAHAGPYIQRLLHKQRALAAWVVMRKALDVDARFRPGSADALLTLIAHAPAGDSNHVDELLTDFAQVYPNSTRRCEAMFVHARLCLVELGRYEQALSLTRRIDNECPDWDDDAYRLFRTRLLRNAR